MVLFLSGCATMGSKKGEESFSNVKYLSCYDGDTCRFQISGVHPLLGENMGVRLGGIDTPEIKGACPQEKDKAIEARDLLRKLLEEAGTIDLIKVRRGKYFRLVSTIVADGVDTSQVLINKGLAVAYNGRTKVKDWCGN